ncbi:MAG: leucine-rich repeat domain-containing protein [Clostridia bacterium]|nr:leucine-rich repeat domain-containing protein [Clostridia bacterium]
MNSIKRFLSFVVALSMILSIVGVSELICVAEELISSVTQTELAGASSGNCGTGLTWTYNNGELKITGRGAMKDYSSDAPWYSYSSEIKTVIVSNGVTYIGNYAFRNCTALTRVTIGDTVTNIGTDAFSGCTSLKEVNIYDIAKWCTVIISDYNSSPFQYADTLLLNGLPVTELVIPEGVTEIGNNIFYNCRNITSVTIPDTVTSIGEYSFYKCINITNIGLGINVKTIGKGAFQSCSALCDITFNDALEYIGSYSFSGSSVCDIYIPANVSYIDLFAFDADKMQSFNVDIYNPYYAAFDSILYNKEKSELIRCYNNTLTKFVTPSCVVRIGKQAFYNMKAPEKVVLSDNITEIGEWAFSNIDSLKEVKLSSNLKTLGYGAFSYCGSLEAIVIPDSLDTVREDAFFYCESLRDITIPEGIKSIENYAFACTGIDELVLPNSLESIGVEAFCGCKELKSIDFGNSLVEISSCAFGGCSALEAVTFPDSLMIISDNAFSFCTSLKDVSFGGNICGIGYNSFEQTPFFNDSSNRDENGLFYVDNYLLDVADTVSGSFEVKEGTIAIGSRAFEGLFYLTSISLPDTLIGIGDAAFKNCTALSNFTIPKNVRFIGDAAFENTAYYNRSANWSGEYLYKDSHLLDATEYVSGAVAIREGTLSIAAGSFSCNDKIKGVVIPEGVKGIYEYTFYLCDSLTSIVIPASVDYIGYAAVSNYDELIISCITDSAAHKYALKHGIQANLTDQFYVEGSCGTDLKWSLNATGELIISGNGKMKDAPWQEYASKIKSVRFEGDITSVCAYAFAECNNLKSIVIPDSVTSLGYGVFSWSGFTEVTIGDGVSIIPTESFDDCSYLVTLNLGAKVSTFEEDWIYSSNLTTVNVDEANQSLSSYNNVIYNKTKTKIVYCPSAYSCDEFEFLPTVTSIAEYAFKYNRTIKKLEIPGTVKSIGTKAFSSCSALESVIIPNSITYLVENMFSGCRNLKDITLPEGFETLRAYSLSGLTSLETLTLPSTFKNINGYAFVNCSNLKELKLPYGTRFIGQYAFYGCNKLTELFVPASIETMHAYAFSKCDNLTVICMEGTFTHNFVVNNNYRYKLHSCDGEWIITEYPTPASVGKKHFICDLCYKVNTADIPCVTEPTIEINGYNIRIFGTNSISYIRYAAGEYTTAAEIKNAPNCVTLDSIRVDNYTDNDICTLSMRDGGIYSLWLKYDDGSQHIVKADLSHMEQYVTTNGVTMTVHDLYGVKDFFIAKGEYIDYTGIKENYIYNVTAKKINGAHDYSYSVSEQGRYTLYIRYNDTTRANRFITFDISVTEPSFTENGLTLTVGNLDNIKLIRTAYGDLDTVGAIKRAQGSRAFTAKDALKGLDEYTIQFKNEGMATVAVIYKDGYTVIYKYNATKKQPTIDQSENSVTISDLDGLTVLRYCKGEYSLVSDIKNAPDSKYIRGKDLTEQSVTIILEKGVYTFYVQYDDGSCNFYNITV